MVADRPGAGIRLTDVAPLPAADSPVELDAGIGPLERVGRWTVPRHLRIRQHPRSRSRIVLDLRAAAVTHEQVEIELRLGVYGTALLVLPTDASADLHGLRGPGRPARSEVPSGPRGQGVHLVVTGVVPCRRAVRVSHAHRWPWWAV